MNPEAPPEAPVNACTAMAACPAVECTVAAAAAAAVWPKGLRTVAPPKRIWVAGAAESAVGDILPMGPESPAAQEGGAVERLVGVQTARQRGDKENLCISSGIALPCVDVVKNCHMPCVDVVKRVIMNTEGEAWRCCACKRAASWLPQCGRHRQVWLPCHTHEPGHEAGQDVTSQNAEWRHHYSRAVDKGSKGCGLRQGCGTEETRREQACCAWCGRKGRARVIGRTCEQEPLGGGS